MKKLTAVILLLIMVLALAACGITKPAAKNEITDLLDQGYECRGWTADETMWRGMFLKGDSYDEILKVTAPMTEKQYEEFNGYFDDEDADVKQMAFLGTLTGVEVTDISDMVPAQEELDAYVGKTLGDMEADGFENTGWTGEPETGFSFYYDGPVYYCRVMPAEGTMIEDMDDFSANDIRAIEIGAVEFLGISSTIVEQ